MSDSNEAGAFAATGSGKSPEEIAFDLVSKLKGQGVWGERNRAEILDMYAECLDAAKGLRTYEGQNRVIAPIKGAARPAVQQMMQAAPVADRAAPQAVERAPQAAPPAPASIKTTTEEAPKVQNTQAPTPVQPAPAAEQAHVSSVAATAPLHVSNPPAPVPVQPVHQQQQALQQALTQS